jgi:hypothetical protein
VKCSKEFFKRMNPTSTLSSRRSTRSRSRVEAEELKQAIATAEVMEASQDSKQSESSTSGPEAPLKKISTVAFEVNKAPKLEGLDREDLMKFMRDYKTYLGVFEEAGADGMEPRALKSMIKPCLLKAICRYELRVEESALKSSQLYAWIKKQTELDKTQGADMTKEMKKLRMKTEGTPLGRVLTLTGDFMEIVSKHGWEETFQGREGRKLEVKFLLEAVRPHKLREKMRQLVQVSEPALQKSPHEFLERLKEKVRSHQEWEDSEEQPPKKQSKGAFQKKRQGPTESDGAQPSKGKRPKIDPTRGKNLECYGCGVRGHPVYACPQKPSKEKVAQILKERQSSHNKAKTMKDYLLVCRLSRSEEKNSLGRIMAKINQGRYLPAVLDSGAMEVCLIPKKIAYNAIRNNKTGIEILGPTSQAETW